MPLFTKHGLKARLDLKSLKRVLNAASVRIDIDDAFADLELWENLPNALSSVSAILVALFSRSWSSTISAGLIGFVVGFVVQRLGYFYSLKVLLPQFLGSWLITIPAASATAWYLYSAGHRAVAIVQLGWSLFNVFRLSNVLLLPLFPLSLFLRQLKGRSIGHVEIALMAILDRQAAGQGGHLNWSLYASPDIDQRGT